jgi:two-component system, LytTR family, sensor kinase
MRIGTGNTLIGIIDWDLKICINNFTPTDSADKNCLKLQYMKLPIILHLLTWILYTSGVFAYQYYTGKGAFHPQNILLLTAEGAALFYLFALFLFPRLLPTRRLLWLAGSILLCWSQHLLTWHYLHTTATAAAHPLFPGSLPTIEPATRAFFFYLIMAFCYYFIRAAWQREYKWRSAEARYEAERRERQRGLELLQSDNAFLRASISPHFLFNTLAFVYNKVSPASAQAAEQVAVLSNLMRYSIKRGDVDGKVSLQEEADHIQNLIRIHQLRYAEQLQISFSISGRLGSLRMIPHLLTSQAEHALKYAEMNDARHPLDIQLSATEEQVHFTIRHRKRNGPAELGFTIGPEEMRKRLRIEYPGRHTFAVEENEQQYHSELIITLTK